MSHSAFTTSAKSPLSPLLDITLPGYQGMSPERRLRRTTPVIGYSPEAGVVCFSGDRWFV
jgi:DNA-binding response OmpR family regulator